MEIILDGMGKHDPIISSTGFLSRELYELRVRRGESHSQDFYVVGSMGHASSIALGVSMMKKSKQVYCFDGDGAAIMHLGAFTQVGQSQNKNFKHILFNNAAHDSVGNQPTCGYQIDFCQIAKACGYQDAFKVRTVEEIAEGMKQVGSGEYEYGRVDADEGRAGADGGADQERGAEGPGEAEADHAGDEARVHGLPVGVSRLKNS